MIMKEKFLKIKSYSEYLKRKEEFKDIDRNDEEIQRHFRTMFVYDQRNGIMHELHKSHC